MNPLDLLDMSEEEQVKWLHAEGILKSLGQVGYLSVNDRFLLAELAFRLRDEATSNLMYWDSAKIEVWQYYCEHEHRDIQLELFWVDWSRPIHWIVAAIKAKQLAEKED